VPATPAHKHAQLFLPAAHQLVDLGDLGRLTAGAAATAITAAVATALASATPGTATLSSHPGLTSFLLSFSLVSQTRVT